MTFLPTGVRYLPLSFRELASAQPAHITFQSVYVEQLSLYQR